MIDKMKIEIFWEQGNPEDIKKSKKKILNWLRKFTIHLGITSMSIKENYK